MPGTHPAAPESFANQSARDCNGTQVIPTGKSFTLFGALLAAAALVVGGLLVVHQLTNPTASYALVQSSTLVVLSGQVELQPAGSSSFRSVSADTPVHPGDTVRTGADGLAVLTYFDGSTTELEPNTTLQLAHLDQLPGGGQRISVVQAAGQSWNRVERLADATSRFETQVPAALAFVQGTEYRVQVDPASQQSLIAAVTDTVVVEAVVNGQVHDVAVPPGFQTTVIPGQAPSPPVPIPPSHTRLRVALDGPVSLWATDSRNRSVGYQPQAEAYAAQIPGATYTVSGGSQTLDLPDPSARYTLVVKGQGEGGPYTVTVTALVDGQPQAGRLGGLAAPLGVTSSSGTAAAGQSLTATMTVAATPLSASIGPWSVLSGPPPGTGAYVGPQGGSAVAALTAGGVLVVLCQPSGATGAAPPLVHVWTRTVAAHLAQGDRLASDGQCGVNASPSPSPTPTATLTITATNAPENNAEDVGLAEEATATSTIAPPTAPASPTATRTLTPTVARVSPTPSSASPTAQTAEDVASEAAPPVPTDTPTDGFPTDTPTIVVPTDAPSPVPAVDTATPTVAPVPSNTPAPAPLPPTDTPTPTQPAPASLPTLVVPPPTDTPEPTAVPTRELAPTFTPTRTLVPTSTPTATPTPCPALRLGSFTGSDATSGADFKAALSWTLTGGCAPFSVEIQANPSSTWSAHSVSPSTLGAQGTATDTEPPYTQCRTATTISVNYQLTATDLTGQSVKGTTSVSHTFCANGGNSGAGPTNTPVGLNNGNFD